MNLHFAIELFPCSCLVCLRFDTFPSRYPTSLKTPREVLGIRFGFHNLKLHDSLPYNFAEGNRESIVSVL